MQTLTQARVPVTFLAIYRSRDLSLMTEHACDELGRRIRDCSKIDEMWQKELKEQIKFEKLYFSK